MDLQKYLTIVIPCKNEGAIVFKTLDLLNYQRGIQDVSVIVSDNSDDGTKEKLQNRTGDKFNLQIDVIVQNILDKINIALKQNQKPNTLSNTEEYFINNISNTYDYNEIEILFLDILFNDGASEYF